jgi:4-amino-4-deoxy-L-arabinose transferase-like glycosyltransferase
MLGARLFDRTAGATAAWVIAVAPLAVRDAHYVKHDVPVTLLIVLSHLALTGWHRNPSHRHLIVAGVVSGLAVSAHYYAIFVAVPLVLTVASSVSSHGRLADRVRRLATAALAAAAAFAVTSPFLLLEPATVIRDVVANREIVVDRVTDAAGGFGSIGFYGRWLAGDALGTFAFAAAVAGIVPVVRGGLARTIIVVSFPITFFLFIGNTFPASRYLNPILPFAALLAGGAIAALSRRGRLGMLASVAGSVLLVAEAGAASVRTDRFFTQTDTRTLALEWFARDVPADTSVLIQPYSAPLRMSQMALAEALTVNLGSVERASVKFRRQLALAPYPAPAYRTIFLGDGA